MKTRKRANASREPPGGERDASNTNDKTIQKAAKPAADPPPSPHFVGGQALRAIVPPAHLAIASLIAEETAALEHLILPPKGREFAADFYEALEERATQFAAIYLERAAMFARSRDHARLGRVAERVTLCEADLNNAWDIIFQEERQ